MRYELPEYVLKKRYAYHYLFLEGEIILNEGFTKKISEFLKNKLGNRLTIEVLIPERYSELNIPNIFHIESNSVEVSINQFYERELKILDQNIFVIAFDFIFYDETCDWELYCSSSSELAVLGCTSRLVDEVREIFKPYEEFSFQDKVDSLGQMFSSTKDREYFISSLTINFSFIKI